MNASYSDNMIENNAVDGCLYVNTTQPDGSFLKGKEHQNDEVMTPQEKPMISYCNPSFNTGKADEILSDKSTSSLVLQTGQKSHMNMLQTP